MQNLVVVGLQWGDEGKGKIVDYLSEFFDIIVRFQGGSNAGHTVVVGEDVYKFRIMPAGSIRGKQVVIGNGVVIDPVVLLDEINRLRAAGIEVKLLISDRAHVITEYQIQMDRLQEASKGGKKVGTTGRGIGPAYSDKASRLGIRVCDFFSGDTSQWQQLQDASISRIEQLSGSKLATPVQFSYYRNLMMKLQPYVGDSGDFLEESISRGNRVLFEGAQGALLDVDHGTYPFVTSSNCMSAAAATGTGISPLHIKSVLGICKSYTTRVGTGPFPTELFDTIGERIRNQGGEFGTVTGRPRRCGWLDAVALKYAVRINGAAFIAITKLDVLNDFETLKVCIKYELDGDEMRSIPASASEYSRVKPIYEEMPGWDNFSFDPKESYDNLPGALREYLAFIEQSANCRISILSLGPDRKDTLFAPGSLLPSRDA
ncbi:MAG: adenylosuccinate synthase [Candidatus Thorarchaeota archaeon]